MRYVVTGASRGIGRVVANTLAQAGHSLVLVARNEEKLRQVQQELGEGQHDIVALDLNTFSDSKQWTYSKPVNGLVYSAGIAPQRLLVRQSPTLLSEIFQVNTVAPMLLTKALLNPMLKTGGDLIYLSSVLATRGVPGMSAYASSKGAIESFVKTIAREYSAKNIRANAIAPALVATDMGKSASPELLKLNAVEEFVDAQDIANAVMFLLSTKSVNGSTLKLDHGACA